MFFIIIRYNFFMNNYEYKKDYYKDKTEILKRMDYIIDNDLDDIEEFFEEYQQLGKLLIELAVLKY